MQIYDDLSILQIFSALFVHSPVTSGEKAEMDIPVFLLFHETGMPGEGICPRVFQNQHSPFIQHTLPGITYLMSEYSVRYGIQPFEGIGRIGEDDIESQMTDIDELEHIVPYHPESADAQRCGIACDEGCMERIHLHAVYVAASSGSELETYAAGTGEEVQNTAGRDVAGVFQNVEQTLLREVGSRSGFQGSRRLYGFTFQGTAYDTHQNSTLHCPSK